MIGRLEGLLIEKAPEAVVLDVAGVGYELRVPLSTYFELPDEGKTVSLRVHTHVREDVLQLYGFGTEQERTSFRLLIGVSGVGPRMALAILSGLRVERLLQAIRTRDLAALRGVPGVGPKTAERILVDLHDKVGELESVSGDEPRSADAEEASVSALLNLGYPRGHAQKAVRRALEQLPESPALEDLIREALRVAAR